MGVRDLHSNIGAFRGTNPTAGQGVGTVNGQAVDLRGFDSCEFVLAFGTITGTGVTATPLIEESDTGAFGGEENAVADADLLPSGTGQEAAVAATEADDNAVRRIGYKGSKRYVRCQMVVAGTTPSVDFAIIALLGRADMTPVAEGA